MSAVAVASGPVSEFLEELQFTLGVGPGVDALAARHPILEPDLDGGAWRRWPGYGPAAVEKGVRAVFAFPLQVGAAQVGVFGVYRDRPGSLSPGTLALALSFAGTALGILLDEQVPAEGRRAPLGRDEVFVLPYVVYQAQGMTMIDLGTTVDDAMVRLRAYAYAQDRSLRDVATDIVEGTLRLERDLP